MRGYHVRLKEQKTTMTDSSQSDRISKLLDQVGIDVAVRRDGDEILLAGIVTSEENRQAALDVAEAVAKPAGLRVVDNLEVLDILPDDAFSDADPSTEDLELSDEARDSVIDDGVVIELDPDFSGTIGTTSARRAAEEGETYFPPTDPVVRPVNDDEALEIVGGFSATAMDDDDEVNARTNRGPEQIAEDVRQELIADALTTDLTVDVDVRGDTVYLSGSVPSLDDAENAQAVAARVSGPYYVREDLKIEPE